MFGGQQLALAAAQRTVDGWSCHALTGFFESCGKVDRPFDLVVERTRDGRRFASRRVLASQDGAAMFDLIASFNAAAPAPETLVSMREFVAAHADRFPAWAKAIYDAPFPLNLRLAVPEAAYFGEGARDIHVVPRARAQRWSGCCSARAATGLARGRIVDRGGRLIASVMQDVAIRFAA